MTTSIELDGVTFVDTDFLARGHLALVSVGGTSYPRFQALWVAGLNQLSTSIAQVGGLGTTAAFDFSTTTADADPGAGALRLNNATQSSATEIYANLADVNGADITALLDSLDDSTSTNKGTLALRQIDDNTKWLQFNVTAVTSASGYRKLSVSYLSGSAASPFSDAARINMVFTRTGDKGDAGSLDGGTLTADIDGDNAFTLKNLPDPDSDQKAATRASSIAAADDAALLARFMIRFGG